MKILVLANIDVGLYRFRRELLSRLLEEHKVTISLPDGDLVRPLEEMGCTFVHTPVERRGMNPAKDFRLFLRYLALIRREKPELVITYTIKPNVYGGLACRLMGVPYAANVTGLGTAFQKSGGLKTLVTTLYRWALKRAKTVFFENAENRQTLLDERIVREAQCVLLPGAGVNLNNFSPAPYPEDDGPTRFLFMGRVMAEKGVDELFAAVERLNRSGTACTLDVLGFCEEDYEEKIRAGERAGWLRYHGYQTNVTPFIAAAHCFVLPSWHEGMANTNLECAAMARPVITSRIPGCMEAVDEGSSGFLCEVRNIDSLCAAMDQFCHLPRDAREKMGLAGRARMERLFDKRIVVEQTVSALDL